MSDTYHLLDLMIKDMKEAPELYRPSQFWEHGVKSLLKDLSGKRITHFRSLENTVHYFTPRYGFPGYDKNSNMGQTCKRLIEEQKTGDPRWPDLLENFFNGSTSAFHDYRVFLATDQNKHPYLNRVSESSVGNPSEQFHFDGRNFSRSFLNYLLGLNCLKTHCDLSDVQTVLEIGGGFGTLGEILLGDDRNHCFYIDVDIPPTSYVATYYLKEIFGSHAIGDYANLSHHSDLDINRLASDFQAVVLCPWQLPRLKGKIDLFVNSISFQEMEPDIVENYLKQVDRLDTKYILLRNLKEGKPKAKDKNSIGVKNPVKGDDYDSFLPNYNLKATNTVPFGLLTVDNFHSEIRIYERR